MKNRVSYLANSNDFIEENFKKLIPRQIDNGRIKIYNVGQGNYVELKLGGKIFLYDIGMTIDQDDLNNNKIKFNYTNIFPYHRPDAIILSHWDIDHILGVVFLNSEHIFNNTIWLAPNFSCISNLSQSAYRLGFYLLSKKKIHLVENYNSCLYKSQDNKFKIWQGKGTATARGGNKANNIGLLIELKDIVFNRGSFRKIHSSLWCLNNILLTGDCDYCKMPDLIANNMEDYDILMVPHHGADTTIPHFCNVNRPVDKLAIISYGKNNHKHPGKFQHLPELMKNYYITKTQNKYKISLFFTD